MIRSHITGTGSYLPSRVVTNAEISTMVDATPEWIVERSGIEQRHWVEGTVTTSDLALEASRRALDAAGLGPRDLDMIVLATISPDHDFPGTGCFLQDKLDAPGIPAIDVRQQCSGFIYALHQADAYIRLGQVDRVLVVGAEIHSKGIDLSPDGKDIAVLFGDGAGAVILESTANPTPDQPQIYSTHIHSDGSQAKTLWAEYPSQASPGHRIRVEDLEAGRHFPFMDGKRVFLNAVKRMPESIDEALKVNGMNLEDIDLFFFHQANLRINEAVAKRLHIDPSKVINTIQRTANTTAATIPICIDHAVQTGQLEPGMLVACSAFGSGFTWGSALLRY